METLHIALIGLGAAVVLVLLALLVNLFRQLTRLALAVGMVLAMLALGAVALSFVTWPEVPAPVEVHLENTPAARPGPSAATVVIVFLLALIVVGLVATGGAALSWHWWKERQKQARYQEMLQQAQVYAVMSGERLPTGTPRRLPQGGNVIVVGGQQDTPAQTIPGGDMWEVLQ